MTKYKTVVIDFPWMTKGDRVNDRTIKYNRKPIYRRTLSNADYDLMNDEEIRNFPIDDYAAKTSLLFLWVTNGQTKEGTPIIELALEIIKKFGFKFKTIITWCKPQGVGLFSPVIVMTEHCLFAFRGSWNSLINKQYGVMSNYFNTTNQVYHSQKPYKFYQLLRSWTPKPRIDLFARNAHEGFDGWGNEYVGKGPLMEYLEE